jgi:hypothetical protein
MQLRLVAAIYFIHSLKIMHSSLPEIIEIMSMKFKHELNLRSDLQLRLEFVSVRV